MRLTLYDSDLRICVTSGFGKQKRVLETEATTHKYRPVSFCKQVKLNGLMAGAAPHDSRAARGLIVFRVTSNRAFFVGV
jgi:hypothetical protein